MAVSLEILESCQPLSILTGPYIHTSICSFQEAGSRKTVLKFLSSGVNNISAKNCEVSNVLNNILGNISR